MLRKPVVSRNLLLVLAVLFFTLTQTHAQCKPPANQNPPLSPAEEADVNLSGKALTVYYCAPSLRGRKVGDQIAPYGKVWRTGANTATTLKTEANLRIGSQNVPAGTYTLYSVPAENGWKLIINKQTGQWGTVYKESEDLARISMMKATAPSVPVEKFEIKFEGTHGNRTQMHLMWGDTNVYVPVTATE